MNTKKKNVNILNALRAREAVNNPYLCHLDMLYESGIAYDPVTGAADHAPARRIVRRETRLAELGNRYFDQGYRLKRTHRFPLGVDRANLIPKTALVYRYVPSGYLAACEQERIEYVVKFSNLAHPPVR